MKYKFYIVCLLNYEKEKIWKNVPGYLAAPAPAPA